MCGRFTYKFSWTEIHDHLQGFVDELTAGAGVLEQPERYNIAPTQPILAIRNAEGLTQAQLMRWGLVPSWVKDPRDFPLIINARSETIMEKPSFRGGLRHHRCIIPASGYYEWRTDENGKKQPFYITLKEGDPMAFAGVWSTWMGPDGEEIDSAAIITLPASDDLKHIHARMPAMLEQDDYADWLNVRDVDEKQAQAILRPLPTGVLQFHPVSARVGAVRNDDPALIQEVEPSAADAKPEAKKQEKGRKKTRAKAPAKKKSSGQMDLF